MALLSLQLFNHFQANLDGKAVTRFESNKVRALLSYLALESERPHSRDELAGLFWPDQSNRKARNNLRQALANLRMAINDPYTDPAFLLISRSTIQFNPASEYTIDVIQFNSLLDDCGGHNHRHPDRCHSCAKRRQQAVELYTGDFLKDLSLRDSFLFDEWTLLQRERLRPMALAALDGLVRYHERQENWEQAANYARRGLELDPWREEAHQQLMRALAYNGKRSTALAQFHTCRKILDEELGIEPTQATTTLYEHILNAELHELASEGTPDTNLPQPISPLIGRQRELLELIQLLDRADCRLVTLTGPGGVGKTRLALETAREVASSFNEGAYFVSLAPVASTDFLVSTIAEALSITFSSQLEPLEQLTNYLGEKEILLVLDNYEHMLPGTDLLAELLKAAPSLTLLITSRERLKLTGEWIVDLAGLPLAESEGTDQDAVIFFLQQARRMRTDWQVSTEEKKDIVQICQLVEGFPLAIELIVPWLRLLSPNEILAELQADIGLIAAQHTSLEGREISLQKVYDRSWRLLTADEQRALAWLSIFRGGFDRTAADEVVGALLPLLSDFVDKSLIRREDDDRYHLHELLRHYALAKLADRGDMDTARQAQLTYYTTLVEDASAQFGGELQRQALQALEDERHNIYDLLQWTIESGDQDSAIRLAAPLGDFWIIRAYFYEGIYWFEKVLAGSVEPAEEAPTARCQLSLGILHRLRGNHILALKWLKLARTGITELSDQAALGRTLVEIGQVYLGQSEAALACEYLEAGRDLAITMGDRYSEALALNYLGNIAIQQSDYEAAQRHHEESLALRREIGDKPGMATSYNNLGVLAAYRGEYEKGRVFFEKSLALQRELGDKQSIPLLLNNIGDMSRFQGDYATVKEHYEEALNLNKEAGNRPGMVWTLENLGIVSRDQGDYVAAQEYLEEGLTLEREIGNRSNEANLLGELGLTALNLGEFARAGNHLAQAITMAQEIGNRWSEGLFWSHQGFLQFSQGEFTDGQTSSQKAVDLSREVNAHFVLGHALTILGHNLLGEDEIIQAQAAYEEAYHLRKTAGQTNLAMEPLAGLARVAITKGNMDEAQTLVGKILAYLDEQPLFGAMHPFLVNLTCIQGLYVAGDPRFGEILTVFYNQLRSQADKLPSNELQETYLAIPPHQEIVHLWQAAQSD